jgi:hypothetical protein
MTISNGWIALAFLFEAFFWLSVYVLIIRTGFRHKIHAMPVLAMCGNISWEVMLGMGSLGGPFAGLAERFPACPASWPSCPERLIGGLTLSAALLDVVIAYIIIRFGVRQIQWDWLAKRFRWLVPLGIAAAFTILITSVSDLFVVNPYPTCAAGENVGCVAGVAPAYLPLSHDGGFATGAILAVIMAMLFITWIHTRDDLRGQSFYIALFMFLGNASAYVVALLWSGFELSTLAHVLSVVSLTLNLLYVVLFVRRARELGINPLKLT